MNTVANTRSSTAHTAINTLLIIPMALFYHYDSILILLWISNYIHYKIINWDENNFPFRHPTGAAFKLIQIC